MRHLRWLACLLLLSIVGCGAPAKTSSTSEESTTGPITNVAPADTVPKAPTSDVSVSPLAETDAKNVSNNPVKTTDSNTAITHTKSTTSTPAPSASLGASFVSPSPYAWVPDQSLTVSWTVKNTTQKDVAFNLVLTDLTDSKITYKTELNLNQNFPSAKLQNGVYSWTIPAKYIALYILGGTAVVSPALEAELNDKPYYHFTVQRLAGVTRYGTAAEIAKQVKPSGGGEVIIATGENFPDSLSISPYASALGIPMVLVEKNNLPAESLTYLKDLKPTDITIVGGVGAVSAQVEGQLQDLFPEANFRRFGGFDQYETSAMIADALFGDVSPNLFVATGTNFPDALAGSIFAGSTLSPIVLVKPNQIPEELSSVYLNTLSPKKIVVLGGTSVVSENVFSTLKSLRN